MGWWRRRVENFNQTATDPPGWMRVIWPPLFIGMSLELGFRRGWLVGAIALVVYGSLGVGMALWPRRIAAWSRRNPGLDSALLGPLVFLALAFWKPDPIWVSIIGGVLGLILGYSMGLRRGRRLEAKVREQRW